MIKRLFNPFLFSLTLVFSSHVLWAAELPTEKDLQAQIEETKNLNRMKLISL
ncbi:potassium efflux protein KefA [Actinobacillus equuli]|nr:potassium efflux protein KefA [Actinobacillus equuli]